MYDLDEFKDWLEKPGSLWRQESSIGLAFSSARKACDKRAGMMSKVTPC